MGDVGVEGLSPMRLIDICGFVGGCRTQQEAEWELRAAGFDPALVLRPDQSIAEEYLADGMAHTTIADERGE